MTEISKYNQFINEICSFEWERTILDRNDDDHKYLDANYEPIPLLRLPKYNQLNGDYEKFIKTLRSDAYNEILLFEDFKIGKVLYRLNEIEMEFNEFWKIWFEMLTSINETKKGFDYSEVVTIMYLKFKIIDFNTNAYFSDGFNGSFGLITDEFKSDLYDALLLKDGQLHQLIYDLKNYLKPIETPAPAEGRGFDLGLTDEQLTVLYQKLIDNKFLEKKSNINHFKNAFNGEVLKDFERFKWVKSVCLAIFLKVNFDTERKDLKVWKNAEKIFDNGNANSLKTADKGYDTHKQYHTKLSEIVKSLP